MSTATTRHSQVIARCVCVFEFTISTVPSACIVTRLECVQRPIALRTRKLLKSGSLGASFSPRRLAWTPLVGKFTLPSELGDRRGSSKSITLLPSPHKPSQDK